MDTPQEAGPSGAALTSPSHSAAPPPPTAGVWFHLVAEVGMAQEKMEVSERCHLLKADGDQSPDTPES